MEERNVYCGAHFTTVLLDKLVCSLTFFYSAHWNKNITDVIRLCSVRQRGPTAGNGLQRWIVYGDGLQGPRGASALCGVGNKGRVSDEGPCWQHPGSAAMRGQRPADNGELRCEYQVRRRWELDTDEDKFLLVTDVDLIGWVFFVVSSHL